MSKKKKKKGSDKPKKPAKPAKQQAKPAIPPPKRAVTAAPPKKPTPALPPTGKPPLATTPPKAPPAPRRKSATTDAAPLKPPVVRVKHAIFGIGKLVREMPEGKIEVQFEGKVGRKTLLASFVEVLPPVLGT